ncbi:MAG: pyruvate formate lyase family protein [Candidatus Omnitrophota bacterium]
MSTILLDEIKQDPDLKSYTMENLPLLKQLRDGYLKAKTAICIERAVHITQYMKEKGLTEHPILARANAVHRYLSQRKPLFFDENRIAGSSTSKAMGAPVYPELAVASTVWPELDTIGQRPVNPQLLTQEEANELNFNVFPFWMDRSVLEVTRKRLREEGKTSPQKQSTYEALRLMEKMAFYINSKSTVISHTIPYYEDVLHKGLNAMIGEAETRKKALHPESNPEDKEKAVFYDAMAIAMRGILAYAQNLSHEAQRLAETEPSPEKKKQLREMARICSRVPANPAASFREAVNALWLCQVGILAENVNMAMSPGRLDQILYPFFQTDIEKNQLTVTEALNLIGCLWFKIADNTNMVPATAEKMFGGAGSVPAVTLGGVDQAGHCAVNDLTYLMLKVTELLRLKDPNVNARYFSGVNPDAYRDRVIRVIMNTRAIPAFFNDKANIETLCNQGVTLEHARDYGVVGCVELTSCGREYAATSSIILNLSAAMDMTLYNGKRPYITGDQVINPVTRRIEEAQSFDEFQTAFESHLKKLVQMSVSLNEELGKTHQQMFASPLMSCFFQGPMEKGKDLIFGGARYNSSGATHVAFADVCDSLNAVERAVFTDKVTTMTQLIAAIETNFEKDADLLAYLKNKAPKYGTDDSHESHPVAVNNSQRLVKFLYDLYHGYTNYRGGTYRPAYWSMTNHAGLGVRGQALPSGRKAYEVFSSGITPASQCTKDLTGAYKAVAELGHTYIPGCVALNMKYTPMTSGNTAEAYLQHFAHMLEGYFAAGGMQVQYNLYTYQDLQDAQSHPEKYPDLIVRVSGYSAFFKDLNKDMQHELITRTQYDLYSGTPVKFVENGGTK